MKLLRITQREDLLANGRSCGRDRPPVEIEARSELTRLQRLTRVPLEALDSSCPLSEARTRVRAFVFLGGG